MKKQILIPFLILLFLLAGTIIIVLYGKGYRFGLVSGRPEFLGTGLLVATSEPDGASVFIDNHLTTATDNTINLSPGKYQIRIFKEGYFPWEKEINVQKEVVIKAQALLFPTAPKLENITSSGVENPVVDPSSMKLAYRVASQSARKNGIYVLDMTQKPILTLQSAASQIADDTEDLFSKADYVWSPDGKELLATISQGSANQTIYLLSAGGLNQNPRDVTATIDSVKETWQQERNEKEKSRIGGLKQTLQKQITDNFNIISWSADETRILYQASASATLPIIIAPRLIGADSETEERELKKEAVYVYDIKEDKNFKVFDSLTNSPSPLAWFPDSRHLVSVHDKKIEVMEYDGANATTIYAGPFMDNYVFPWPNGSKVVVLTNLGNPDIPPNLYTISLK